MQEEGKWGKRRLIGYVIGLAAAGVVLLWKMIFR
jgi:hypothetical protein